LLRSGEKEICKLEIKEKYSVKNDLYLLDNKLFIGKKTEKNWKLVIDYVKKKWRKTL